MSAPEQPQPLSLEERLLAIIAKDGMVDREKLQPDASLDSLGVESADVIVILLSIEDEFGVYIPVDTELSDVKTVADLLRALSNHITEAKG